MRTLLFAAGALSALIGIACTENPEPKYAEGGYGAQYPQGGYGAQYPGTGAQTPGTGASTPGTGGTGAAPATPSKEATPINPAAAAAASPLLRGMAQKETAGMKEDGAAMAGQFQEGQVLEQPVQIQPGRCYTVVGVGIGITELDVELVVHQPPMPEYVAATDGSSGPQAVLGGGSKCFKNPLPFGGPGKLRMRATGGSGVALAQLYSK
ncbi:MAG TPA: hypothetical protein VFB62_07695 [Polyangiaceae bacterium]|jgi:hypothetical protein|nr:hypothetical protein [Polyangiaceae bacterium]